MKNLKNQRRISREICMQIIYQIDVNKEEVQNMKQFIDLFLINNEDNILERYNEIFDTKKESIYEVADIKFIEDVLSSLNENREKIDTLITENTKNWSINRMAKVDVSILRIALSEILSNQDIPTKVSINEAIEIAKVYSDDKTPKFINGILGSIVDKI
ncbi:MAG: transcription antitermination factor NusB [Peptostreptococcaceae bacterium]